MQTFVHYFLHFGFPIFIAYFFFKSDWKKVYVLLVLTMLVDLDHLLTDPIYLPTRCSIQFHPLHSYYAMAVYFLFLFLRRPFKIIGLGLLFHMFTDLIDCLLMFEKCRSCFDEAPARGLLGAISNMLGLS